MALDECAPAARADAPAQERAGQVAERAGQRQDDVALDTAGKTRAEERRVLAGDRAGGEHARVGMISSPPMGRSASTAISANTE